MQFNRDRLESDSGIVSNANSTISTNLTSLTDPIGVANVGESMGFTPLDTSGLLAEPLNPIGNNSTLRNQTLSSTATSDTLQKRLTNDSVHNRKDTHLAEIPVKESEHVRPESTDKKHSILNDIDLKTDVNNVGSNSDKALIPMNSSRPAQHQGDVKAP